MKQNFFSFAVIAIIALGFGSHTFAQEVTIGDLKAKGGTVLSAEELKALLPGAIARYETAEFVYQQKFEPDGSSTGSWQRRLGGAQQMVQFSATWSIEDGRWCGIQRSYRSNEVVAKYCRDIINVGDKSYYASGNRNNDGRTAYEIRFNK